MMFFKTLIIKEFSFFLTMQKFVKFSEKYILTTFDLENVYFSNVALYNDGKLLTNISALTFVLFTFMSHWHKIIN